LTLTSKSVFYNTIDIGTKEDKFVDIVEIMYRLENVKFDDESYSPFGNWVHKEFLNQ